MKSYNPRNLDRDNNTKNDYYDSRNITQKYNNETRYRDDYNRRESRDYDLDRNYQRGSDMRNYLKRRNTILNRSYERGNDNDKTFENDYSKRGKSENEGKYREYDRNRRDDRFLYI